LRIAPVTDKMMSMRMADSDMRSPTNGMRNQGQSSLYDALGAEMKRREVMNKKRMHNGTTPMPTRKRA